MLTNPFITSFCYDMSENSNSLPLRIISVALHACYFGPVQELLIRVFALILCPTNLNCHSTLCRLSSMLPKKIKMSCVHAMFVWVIHVCQSNTSMNNNNVCGFTRLPLWSCTRTSDPKSYVTRLATGSLL